MYHFSLAIDLEKAYIGDSIAARKLRIARLLPIKATDSWRTGYTAIPFEAKFSQKP